ncbi:MAG TPA: hypothetical protein VGL71_08095, partial [Urbifossiella sp.]
MGKTKRKSTTKKTLTETPLYTLWDAARYLHLPVAAVARLTGSLIPDSYWINRPWPENDDDLEISIQLSFREFTVLFVKSCLLRIAARTQLPDGNARSIWNALEMTSRMSTTSLSEVARRLLRFVAASSDDHFVEGIRVSLRLHLDRVVMTQGRPLRLFPFTRDPSQDAPRTIAIDPRMRFGR